MSGTVNTVALPEEFLSRMKTLLGKDYPAFLASRADPPARGLHVNLHKITAPDFVFAAGFPVFPLPGIREGFSFDYGRIGNHPLHHAGAVYVQEPSAMMPLSAIVPSMLPKSPKILDVCAAPGGKSSQAANLIAGDEGRRGMLVANEVIPGRCRILAGNIERLGIRNAMVTHLSAGALAEYFRSVFDLTLVDAPCSGEGMFRKNPDAIAEWTPGAPSRCAGRQREILWAAADTVAAGGYLLYSTCTFSVEENEAVAAAFLADHPGFIPVMPPEPILAITAPGIAPDGSEMPFCRRFYPHLARGEGQFAAIFRKTGGDMPDFHYQSAETAPSKAESAVVRAFLTETVGDAGENLRLIARKDGIYAVSPDFPIPPTGVFSPGVKIGAVQKGRVIPDHRFFMAYGSDFLHRMELDADEAAAYLRGSILPRADFTGWGTATYAGCALGGVKAAGGAAKNHYPKGLRVMG